MRLKEALAELELALKARGRSRRTVEWYASHLKRLLDFFGEDTPVEEITLDHLRRFATHLYERDYRYRNHHNRPEINGGLSIHTIYGCIRAIRFLFKFLWQEGHLSHNPAARLSLPELPDPKPRGISLEGRVKLLAVAETARDRAIVLLISDTGCRAGELASLRLQDLDLENGLALVRGKRGRVRALFLTPPTVEALREYLKERGSGGPEEEVFLGRGGKPLTVSGLEQLMRRLKAKAGLDEPCNPHAFRHGLARDYLLDGGDMGTLSDILGHQDGRPQGCTTTQFSM